MKKISILITAYNQEKYIVKAVESVLMQDYSHMEIIVSDDCSFDKTDLAIQRFLKDEKVKYFKNVTRIGRVANYRKSLYEYATGDLVLVLDGDDYLIDISYIKKAVSLLEKNDLIMVFAKKKVLFEREKTLVEDKMNDKLPMVMKGDWLFLNYYKGYSIPHLSTLYKRRKAMEIGYYKEDILSSDWDSVLRLMMKNKIGFINEYIGVWRKHSLNESKTSELEKHLLNTRYIVSPYEYALEKGFYPPKVLKKWKIRMLRRHFAKVLLKFPNRHEDIKFFCKKNFKKEYISIMLDPRIKALMLASKNKMILRFIFVKIIKNESLYKELPL